MYNFQCNCSSSSFTHKCLCVVTSNSQGPQHKCLFRKYIFFAKFRQIMNLDNCQKINLKRKHERSSFIIDICQITIQTHNNTKIIIV